MFLIKIFRLFLVLTSIILFSCSSNDTAQEDENNVKDRKIKWKMASTFPGTLTQLGTAGVRFQNQIEKISAKNIQVKFFEPGALVPALEVFDAVSSGSIDAGWATPGY